MVGRDHIQIVMVEVDGLQSLVSERMFRVGEIVSVLPILGLFGLAVVQILTGDSDPQSGMFAAYMIIIWPLVSSFSITALAVLWVFQHLVNITISKVDLALICVHTLAAVYIIILISIDVGIEPNEYTVLAPLGVVIGSSIVLSIHILVQNCRGLFS